MLTCHSSAQQTTVQLLEKQYPKDNWASVCVSAKGLLNARKASQTKAVDNRQEGNGTHLF